MTDHDEATDAMMAQRPTRHFIFKMTEKMRKDLLTMAKNEGRTPTGMLRRLIQLAAIERLGINR